MNKKDILKSVGVGLLIVIIVAEAFLFVGNWAESYPNYLLFQPKIKFGNNYYSIELTCFLTQLKLKYTNILAYLGAFTLEESYQKPNTNFYDWNLEAFDRHQITEENENYTTVETWSHLYTFNIHKIWTFYKHEPRFKVTITKTYLFDSESKNNQIIVDIQNQAWKNVSNTFTYKTSVGIFNYTILSANPNATIQSPCVEFPTESQIDFYGERDDTVRQHKQGETETIMLEVYADPNGMWLSSKNKQLS